MPTDLLALVAVVLLALAASFQLALAAGAPWGAMAYGGRVVDSGALPRAHRLASAVAALVLVAAGWAVLAKASLAGDGSPTGTTLTVVLWCLAGLFALNTLGNARGRHPVERWGAGAVTGLLAVLCALLATR